jgi:nucleotide-binding universal stress UspA family protein
MSYLEVGEWSNRAYPAGAVVVGYNGKLHGSAALAWGARDAVRRGVPLLVLYAANYPGMTMEPGDGLLARDPGALEAAYEVTARGVAEALTLEPGLEVYGATEVTSPSQALTAAAGAGEASLLVLGSRGYGRVVGALLGSVAFAVAAQAPCPVVVVKDEAALAAGPGPGRPVVVGTDGSFESVPALDFAAARAALAEAPLQVITCTGGVQVVGIDEAGLHAAAERIACQAAEQVRRAHPELDVTTHVEDRRPEEALVAASAAAGLVVVGSRGRGAYEGLLLGSVSHAVIHGAECVVGVV